MNHASYVFIYSFTMNLTQKEMTDYSKFRASNIELRHF